MEVPEATMPQEFFATVERHPHGTAATFRGGPGEAWQERTWREMAEDVRRFANGLLGLGIRPGDRVAVLADTSYPWAVADLAILSAGAVTTTVYTTLNPNQVGYLLTDSGSRVVVVDTQEQLDKVREVREETKDLEVVVTVGKLDAGELEDVAVTVDQLMADGDAHASAHPDHLDEHLENANPRDPATIVYTSGTTGRPKGTVLTHRNFVSAAEAALIVLDQAYVVGPGTVGFNFLPLAHVYQRLATFLQVRRGATMAFTDPSRIVDDLRELQPNLVASVPRIYERMYDAVIEQVQDAPALRQRIFRMASDHARAYGKALANGGTPSVGLQLAHAVYDRLVFSTIRENLGMEGMEVVITGAAAIRPDLLFWLRGVGIPILEGYGLTETSAPSNLNLPGRFKPGTVGPPLPGVEQRIGEEGEVLMRGPNIFESYWNLPNETQESFTEDGWFRSGDLGEFDEDGYLRIIDRLKEIEVLSTGKNVAPVPIEEALKNSDLIEEAMVVGSDRKFVSALLQPSYEGLLRWADKHGVDYYDSNVERETDATEQEVVVGVGRDLLDNARVQELFQREVDKANADFAHYEQVKRFRLLPHAITVDRDELTPTLKKKRRNIRDNWRELIDGMYPED